MARTPSSYIQRRGLNVTGSRMKKRTRYTRKYKNVQWMPLGRYAPLRAIARRYNRIPRGIATPFPRTRLVRHRYVENITFPAAAGAGFPTSYVFAANGIYDPNVTGVGHQPLYHDEMAALYQYYTVVGSRIKVTFSQNPVDQQNYGIILSQDSSLASNPTLLKEEYGSSVALIPSQRNMPFVQTKNFSAKKIFKTNMAGLLSDDTQRVQTGTNPGTKALYYFVIWRGPIDGGVTLATSIAQVEMSFIVLWREPKDAVQS